MGGYFETRPAIATQLCLEIYSGEYIFAVTYMDFEIDYSPLPGERMVIGVQLRNSTAGIKPLLFSVQYNNEKFTLTGECSYRWNSFGDFAQLGGGKYITESGDVEGSYRLFPALRATIHVDTISVVRGDPNVL